jgi:4-amino-4-deoxy-L-arabinose transferase-like glycosyltransferase
VRLSARAINKAESVAVFAALLGLVVTLQVLGGAYASGFGGYPDEPAHLVTSLMVRDFLAGLDFRHPWQFAQRFYFHYPEVAIGVWPPGFYGALGLWFLIFGASRASALMFIAIVATTTASVMYFLGKRLIGRWAGVLAAVLFIASPLVQDSSARVMTEHVSTLGMLLSTLCFARFARTGQIGDALTFGAVAAATILTHGNGWALGLVPGLAIALTNRWYLLRRLAFWAAALPVMVTCVPWYVFADSMFNFWQPDVSLRLQALPEFAWCIYLGVGLPVLIFALIGAWTTIVKGKPRIEVAPEWGALAGLVIATFLLYWIVPIGIEGRYVVAVIPAVLLFSTAGVNLIAETFTNRLPMNIAPLGLALVLMIAFCANSFALPLQLRNGGYEALVRDVKARVLDVPQVWLISSGSTGEGCLVAAVALQEVRPKSYVLRGKTILAGGDWLWRNQQDRFDTVAKLAGLLDEMPVTIVVIDDRVPPAQQRPYQDRLKQLVASEGTTWEFVGSYPQTQDGILHANSLHVYARHPIASLVLAPPVLRLDRLEALMVRKELR